MTIEFLDEPFGTEYGSRIGATSSREFEIYNLVMDDYGRPRLSVARAHFKPLDEGDVDLLVDVFQIWRDFNEYGIIKGENLFSGEKKYLAIKLSKRGNDVFAERMRSRLDFLKGVNSKDKFFDASDFKGRNRSKEVTTQLLWVTLTFDSKICDLNSAWKRVRDDFNLWITKLRNRYGKIWYVAFPQAFPDPKGEAYGYPHIHLIMLFEDQEFRVFPRFELDKKGKPGLVFRIAEKDEIEHQGKWHSFIDVKALSSMRGVLNYARKYAENVCHGSGKESAVNNAVMWLMKKRSYSVSGAFRKAYHDLIVGLRNSKLQAVLAQQTLWGEMIPIWKWTFLGVWSVSDLNLVGDPPPWVVVLEREKVQKLIERKY